MDEHSSSENDCDVIVKTLVMGDNTIVDSPGKVILIYSYSQW